MAKAEIYNLRSLNAIEDIPDEENMHSVFAHIAKYFFSTFVKKRKQRQNKKRCKNCNYKRRQYYDP